MRARRMEKFVARTLRLRRSSAREQTSQRPARATALPVRSTLTKQNCPGSFASGCNSSAPRGKKSCDANFTSERDRRSAAHEHSMEDRQGSGPRRKDSKGLAPGVVRAAPARGRLLPDAAASGGARTTRADAPREVG